MDQIEESLFGIGVSSENRCKHLLGHLNKAKSPMEFYDILALGWSSCDLVSADELTELKSLLQANRKSSPEIRFVDSLEPSDRVWWLSQQNEVPIRVYRGSSRNRISGLSWSLCPDVATGFAFGHRGIAVEQPVLSCAQVNWSDVLFATNDRGEQEVLLDWETIEIEFSKPLDFVKG